MLPALLLITLIFYVNLFLLPPYATPLSPGALVLTTEGKRCTLWVDMYLSGCWLSSTPFLVTWKDQSSGVQLTHTGLITQFSLSQHTITGNTCYYNMHTHTSVPTHATHHGVHIPTLHSDTHYCAPSILHPYLAACALHTLGLKQLGERTDIFFKSLELLCFPFQAQSPKIKNCLRKPNLAPLQALERLGPETVLFQRREGRPAIACLGSGLTASHGPVAPSQMSTQHLLLMSTKPLCPLNQALFCHWNVFFPFLCLLKSSPFLGASHKPHFP